MSEEQKPIQHSFVIGDIIYGEHCDLSPRYYIVEGITPKKLKVRRLCLARSLPITHKRYKPTGKQFIMTIRDSTTCTWYGTTLRKLQDSDYKEAAEEAQADAIYTSVFGPNPRTRCYYLDGDGNEVDL